MVAVSYPKGGEDSWGLMGMVAVKGFSIIVSVAADVFCFLGFSLPFLPLPFGIVASANFDRFGHLLAFLNHATNSGSLLHNSAAATECAHMFNAFQFGQLPSQAKAPPFLGTTRCGFLPL